MSDAAVPAARAPAPPAASAAGDRVLPAALFAAAVALALYVPRVWGHDFVNYDDPYLTAAGNPAIGHGLWGGLGELLLPWTRPRFMNAWLPLYYWSLGLDHALFGASALGWHLHSVVLHAAGAAMVAVVGRRLGLSAWAAAIAGAAFAVHPAATENVAWIASRKDVLSFLWMAFAAWAYLEALRRGRPSWHALGAVCLAVSLTAKGTTLVLPLLLAVHSGLLRKERDTSLAARLRPVTPYALVALAFTAVHLWVASDEGTAGVDTGAGLGALLVADLEVAGRYALLLLLPFRQSVEWGVDAGAVDLSHAVIGAVVLVAAGATVALAWRRLPAVAAVVLCAALALAPFNNLLPRTSVLFAERYAHVALLPLALGVGALAGAADGRRWVGLAATAAFGVLSVLRIPVWGDSVTLWQDAARRAPGSALVRLQLADACAERARATPESADEWNVRAEAAWRAAAERAKDELSKFRAEAGLGTQLFTTLPAGTSDERHAARVQESLALFGSALARLDRVPGPSGPKAAQRAAVLVNRAGVRQLLGDHDAALEDWRSATAADPSNVTAWNGLARMSLAAGDGEGAARALARSAELAPDDAAAARERSQLRLAAGDVPGAKGELERVLSRNPDDYAALIDLARLDAALQRPVDAEKRFRRALDLRPGDETATQGLAGALLEQAQSLCLRDDYGAARETALRSAELMPTSSAPEQVLGIVARRAGDLEEATLRFRRARDLYPEGLRIREALASVLLERALAAYDDPADDDATGDVLAEEAAAVDAPSVALRQGRLEWGVGGWPPPPPGTDRLATVARKAAVRALALVAARRGQEALPELLVEHRGTAEADVRSRRNVVRLLVRARFLAGRPDEAVAASEELAGLASEEEPWTAWSDRAAALVERGIVRRSSGEAGAAAEDFAAALKLLDAAAAHGMPLARWRVRRGEALFAEERFVEATREFDSATDADPGDPEPLLDRAALWRTQFLLDPGAKSFLTAAEKDLRAALAISPSDPRAMAALGEILAFATKPSEAYPWLQRALLADPSQAGARALLADLAVRAGRKHLESRQLEDALRVAQRAAELESGVPAVDLFYAEVKRARGDTAGALELLQRAEAAHPDDLDVRTAVAKFHADVGYGLLLQKKAREAAEEFLLCRRKAPEGYDLTSVDERLHGIAVAAFEAGVLRRAEEKFGEAADQFELSVLADPTPEARFNLGLCRTEAGELDAAAAAYADALAADREDFAARMNLAALLLRLGRWDEAEEHYRWFVENRAPDDGDRVAAERQLAWIAEQRAQMERERKR